MNVEVRSVSYTHLDYDDALMEPISLPCNVIGGLGFVGVCSESRVIIELPETVWR